MKQVYVIKSTHMLTIQDGINNFISENKNLDDVNIKIDMHENPNGVHTHIATILYDAKKKAKDYHVDNLCHGDSVCGFTIRF